MLCFQLYIVYRTQLKYNLNYKALGIWEKSYVSHNKFVIKVIFNYGVSNYKQFVYSTNNYVITSQVYNYCLV